MRAAPDKTQHIWKLDGPLEDVPSDEVPSMAWQHMAHTGLLPPIWDLLDLQPSAETLHSLDLFEFTDLLNGCAPDALVRNAFVILRVVATARYLHLKSQELHKALREAHVTIGEEAQAAAAFNTERARLAEWDAGQLRGQIGLVQQDLARTRNDLTAALAQAHTQVVDLDDRLRASVAAERKASACSNQQAMSLAELSARLQQQLAVLTMSASVSPYASASDCDSAVPVQSVIIVSCAGGATHHHRPRAVRHSCLRASAVPAPCMPHLVTGVPSTLQPRTRDRLEGPSHLASHTTRSLPLPPPSSTRRPCVLRVLV